MHPTRRKSMKKTIVLLFAAACLLGLVSLQAGKMSGPPPDGQVLQTLKKTMQQFGTLVAGLEIMRAKEPKPDWPVVAKTLKEMDAALKTMQQADTAATYKKFTDQLGERLEELNRLSQK